MIFNAACICLYNLFSHPQLLNTSVNIFVHKPVIKAMIFLKNKFQECNYWVIEYILSHLPRYQIVFQKVSITLHHYPTLYITDCLKKNLDNLIEESISLLL